MAASGGADGGGKGEGAGAGAKLADKEREEAMAQGLRHSVCKVQHDNPWLQQMLELEQARDLRPVSAQSPPDLRLISA